MTKSTFKIIDSQFEEPVIEDCEISNEILSFWKSEGVINISINEETYVLHTLLTLNDGNLLFDSPKYEAFIYNDPFYFGEGSWKIHCYFESYPDIYYTHRELRNVLIDLLPERLRPLLCEYEKIVQKEEKSYPIPFIENVSVLNNYRGSYEFSFSIKGEDGQYTCSVQYEDSEPNFFLWKDRGIKKNEECVHFHPCTYKLHILEQCFDIIKHFSTYRLAMKFSEHHYFFSFPYFERKDYCIDFSKVDFKFGSQSRLRNVTDLSFEL